MAYTGEVTSYYPRKGFGCIACEAIQEVFGKDVFLPRESLSGQFASQGDKLTFDVKQKKKGPMAVGVKIIGRVRGSPQMQQMAGVQGGATCPTVYTGTIKHWNPHRGLGHIFCETTQQMFGKDIFFGKSVVNNQLLRVRMPVRFTIRLEDKGPAAATLEPCLGMPSVFGSGRGSKTTCNDICGHRGAGAEGRGCEQAPLQQQGPYQKQGYQQLMTGARPPQTGHHQGLSDQAWHPEGAHKRSNFHHQQVEAQRSGHQGQEGSLSGGLQGRSSISQLSAVAPTRDQTLDAVPMNDGEEKGKGALVLKQTFSALVQKQDDLQTNAPEEHKTAKIILRVSRKVIELEKENKCAQQALQKELDTWRDQAMGLQKEVSSLKDELEAKAKTALESIRTLQADLAASKAARQALGSEVETMKEEAVKHAAKLQAARAAEEQLSKHNQEILRRVEIQETEARRHRHLHLAKGTFIAELCRKQLLSRCVLLWHFSVRKAKLQQKCGRAAAVVHSQMSKSEEQTKRALEAQEQAAGAAEDLVRLQRELEKQQALHNSELEELDLKHKQETRKQLGIVNDRVSKIRKDLAELCLCPLTFQPMQQPVLASDLHTYQKDAIEQALECKPASPFTRAFMEKSSLRPNLLAMNLLELTAKHFPHWEAEDEVPRPMPVPVVGSELMDAIDARDSEQAVELLAREAIDLRYLNLGFLHESVQVNLLQLSICLELPKVAIAIIDRPDFRRTESISSQGLLAIHMAAAFNYGDVCRRIIEEMGGFALKARTLRAARLVDPHGRSELIPKDSTAMDCARLFGHQPDWSTI